MKAFFVMLEGDFFQEVFPEEEAEVQRSSEYKMRYFPECVRVPVKSRYEKGFQNAMIEKLDLHRLVFAVFSCYIPDGICSWE